MKKASSIVGMYSRRAANGFCSSSGTGRRCRCASSSHSNAVSMLTFSLAPAGARDNAPVVGPIPAQAFPRAADDSIAASSRACSASGDRAPVAIAASPLPPSRTPPPPPLPFLRLRALPPPVLPSAQSASASVPSLDPPGTAPLIAATAGTPPAALSQALAFGCSCRSARRCSSLSAISDVSAAAYADAASWTRCSRTAFAPLRLRASR